MKVEKIFSIPVLFVTSCIALSCSLFSFTFAAESFESREMRMNEEWSQRTSKQDSQWNNRMSVADQHYLDREKRLDRAWNQMVEAENKKWKEVERSVLKKWDGYRQSSQKVWVDYNEANDHVSQVDFESGEVVVEALLPRGATEMQKRSALKKALHRMENSRDSSGRKVMDGMLLERGASQSITENSATSAAVRGSDGVTREKIGVRLSMVPDHVAKRAKIFLPRVTEISQRTGIDPALVMAIMHTESFFNPMARSSAPAFGLMQIVPNAAGREAYQYLFNSENVPTPEFLYNPDNNILLGTTYLELLFKNYFQDVKDSGKQLDLVVSAYNWGPSAVRRNVVSKVDIAEMSENQVREYLLDHAPNETRKYLINVLNRKTQYSSSQ